MSIEHLTSTLQIPPVSVAFYGNALGPWRPKGPYFRLAAALNRPHPGLRRKKKTPSVVPHVELARPLVPDVVGGNSRVVQTISGDLRARGGAGAKAERA